MVGGKIVYTSSSKARATPDVPQDLWIPAAEVQQEALSQRAASKNTTEQHKRCSRHKADGDVWDSCPGRLRELVRALSLVQLGIGILNIRRESDGCLTGKLSGRRVAPEYSRPVAMLNCTRQARLYHRRMILSIIVIVENPFCTRSGLAKASDFFHVHLRVTDILRDVLLSFDACRSCISGGLFPWSRLSSYRVFIVV